jgi:RND family efflux transporter MFP subunit
MKNASRLVLLSFLLGAGFLAGSWYRPRMLGGAENAGDRKVLYYVDPMHPAYKSDKPGIAPDCGMELIPVYTDSGPGASGDAGASAPANTVNISPERRQLVGVKVSMVEKQSGAFILRLFGRVTPDESRVYRVNAGIDGAIREVLPATTGSQVRKGELLATFISPEFVQASQAYIFALSATDRLKKNKEEFASQIDPLTGDPVNSNYQQRLERMENMGMSRAQIEEVGRTRQLPKSIRIVAPAAGFVLARNVSPGQKFDRGAELYRIADLRRVWVLADVFGRDAQYIKAGAVARVELPGQGASLRARVSEILPQFDGNTRSLKVRLEIDNPAYLLRPDMFVDVELSIQLPSAITVPLDAIVDSGLKKTMFVDLGDGQFEAREVETGWRIGGKVEITKGLSPGERIVTSGTFLVDSETRLQTVAAITHTASHRDPVCGMDIDVNKARAAGTVTTVGGKGYFFCSEQCKREFEKSPGHYLHESEAPKQNQVAARSGVAKVPAGAAR